MERNKDIYKMILFEKIQIEGFDDNSFLTRVPGGWVFTSYCHGKSSCFIPFDNEFQKDNK
jgi:hypothetical protein